MANIAFGSGSMTVPSTSIASFLATGGGNLPVLIQWWIRHGSINWPQPSHRAQNVRGQGPAHERGVYQKSGEAHKLGREAVVSQFGLVPEAAAVAIDVQGEL